MERLGMSFDPGSLFACGNHEHVAWALHTTMNLEKKYQAAMLAKQYGMPVEQTLKLASVYETAFFYNQQKETPITGKGSVNKRIPLDNVSNFTYGVSAVLPKDVGKQPAAEQSLQTAQTFHTKLSLVCIENRADAKNIKHTYRLAVYSKNFTFSRFAEVAVLLDMELSVGSDEDGTQLQAFFGKLYRSAERAGQAWLTDHGLNPMDGALYQAMKTVKLKLRSSGDSRQVHICFGGCGGQALHQAMDFLSCDYDNSVVLTPPAFVVQSPAAKEFFQKHPFLYDLEQTASEKTSHQQEFPTGSHAKLYLLKHAGEDMPETYSLWLGSANCTVQGIGCDFKDPNRAIPHQSIECLVQILLERHEFNQLKKQLIKRAPEEMVGRYVRCDGKQLDAIALDTSEHEIDFWGRLFSGCGEITAVEYWNKDGTLCKPQDFKNTLRLSKIRYTVAMSAEGVQKWKDEAQKNALKSCPVQPMEYGFRTDNEPELTGSTTCLLVEANSGVCSFGFHPAQGLICVGTGGAVMTVPDYLLHDIPRPDGLITPETESYISRLWDCRDEESARRYLDTTELELLHLQEKAGKKGDYASPLAAIAVLKESLRTKGTSGGTAPEGRSGGIANGMLKLSGLPGLVDSAFTVKAAPKPFQERGANALSEILNTHSRAFLADEAGLGKTFTATKLLCLQAEKQWNEQGPGKETPFYALYVGPNTELLKKCCGDIDRAFHNMTWPETSPMHDAKFSYWSGVKRLSELWGPIINRDPGTLPLKPPADDEAQTGNREPEREEMPSGKTVVLIATSVELMGIRSQDKRTETEALGEIAEKQLYAWAEKKGYQQILEDIHGFQKEREENRTRKSNNEKLIPVKKNGTTVYVTVQKAGIAESMVYTYTNRVRAYVEELLMQHFGIVLLDEYHRYFKKLETKLVSAFWGEKNCNTKLLFISATPYQSFKAKDVTMDTEAESDDVGVNQLPEFKEFLKKLYCGGIGLIKPGTNQEEQERADQLAEEYCKLEKAYKEALTELLRQKAADTEAPSVDSFMRLLEANACAVHAKYRFEKVLRQRMVRHERTMLSASKRTEEHLLMGGCEADVSQYKGPLYQVFRQRSTLAQKGYSNHVRNWSEHMPWLLSFGIRNGRKSKDNTELPYYEDMKPPLHDKLFDGADDLFLRRDEQLKTCLDQQQIMTLPEQTVAFRDICRENLSDEACQLLWVPPTVPAYEVDASSIFKRQEDYSKLLVFDEHRFLQRGGPGLLSQYADARNRRSDGTAYAKLLKENGIPFADNDEKGIDITALANKEIPEGKTLREILAEWTGGQSGLTELQALSALADPAVCMMRLGYEEAESRKIRDAFRMYLQKEHCLLALGAWMSQRGIPPEKEAVQRAVLYYCAEGNLFAVLREWALNMKPAEPDKNAGEKEKRAYQKKYKEHIQLLCECLCREKSDVEVYVQTRKQYENRGRVDAGICCACGFAEQLTADHYDVGTATGTQAETAYKGIRDAFNSPFWPMVLFVGRGAQEGLDFHKYCLRIMHLTLPRGAVSFDQRQGRIDRFQSLLVRRRAKEILGIKSSARVDLESAMLQTLHKWKEGVASTCPEDWRNDQIFPDWQIKEIPELYKSRHHFQRMIAVLKYSDEMREYQQMSNQLKSYRSTIGSSDIAIPDEYRHLQIDLAAK